MIKLVKSLKRQPINGVMVLFAQLLNNAIVEIAMRVFVPGKVCSVTPEHSLFTDAKV